MNRLKHKLVLISAPILAGFALFRLIPFLKSVCYSLIDNTHSKNFVWFENYISLFGNKYFLMALKNTAAFSVFSVAAVMLISIIISYFLERNSFFGKFFMLPMLLPTTALIYVWQMFFDTPGYLLLRKGEGGAFFTLLPLYLLYIWKNTGFSVIIISAALAGATREIKEAASLDGAGRLQTYIRISLPCISGELFFAMVLSFVSSLKIYRESSLLYEADYPPDEVYMLQNFMNNHFHKLNYQTLTAATVIFVAFMAVFVILIFRRTADEFTSERGARREKSR